MNKPQRIGRRLLAAICCLFTCLHLHGADLTSSYTWKPMKIGGGGWVVGMAIHPTEKDLVYVRTDVSGAYRWDPTTSSWKQLVTSASMPAASVAFGFDQGVDSLVGAPDKPDIAYMAFRGQIFRSTNRGDTWTATHFEKNHVATEPNGNGRQEGERLAVDPHNSDIVYFGTIGNGLWVTQNAGADWTRVKDIPTGAPEHGVNTVVFDSASRIAGGKTILLYVTVDKGGVYRSNDAGATWERFSDAGPGNDKRIRDSALGPDETYYLACTNDDGATGSVWKYSPAGTGWSDVTPAGNKAYVAVAVDPTDAKHVVAMANGGKCWVSTDGAATWTAHDFRLHSPNIQWLDRQENYWLSVGEIGFDPNEKGKLWFAEGFGVWTATDLTTPEINWQAHSEGIEEACGNDVIAPPGGKPVAAMWDLGAFYFSDPDTYNAQRSQPYFMSGWALDWCPADPKFIVAVFRNHLGFPPHVNGTGYSTDGGQTWTPFPAVEKKTIPAGLDYGIIAVSADKTDNIVWANAGDKPPYYTTDKGVTWQPANFGGATTSGFDNYCSPGKPLCADRVLPGTFYFYQKHDGIYRSDDGGANWKRVGNNPAPERYNSILKTTPGHAQDLWFAEGKQGNVVGGVWHSTDGGATWRANTGIEQAFNIGLGKAEKDGGYPTIYVSGVAKGETGIYRSTNEGKSWDKVGTYPLGIYDYIDALDGDKDIFGKVYIGFTSSGFAYGAPIAP